MKAKKIIGLIALVGFMVLIDCQKQKSEPTLTSQPSVPNSATEICPILVGDTIPNFALSTPEGIPFDLKKALQQKPTVLIFFRGGW